MPKLWYILMLHVETNVIKFIKLVKMQVGIFILSGGFWSHTDYIVNIEVSIKIILLTSVPLLVSKQKPCNVFYFYWTQQPSNK